MKEIISFKYYLSVLLVLLSSQCLLSQTKIAEETFETIGGYSTNIPEHNNLNSIYFTRTDGTDIGPTFTNFQDSYFFGAQNIDGEPDGSYVSPQVLTIDDIDISGYTSLELRVFIAEASDGSGEHWENITFPLFGVYNDYMHIDCDIDNSGVFENLIWVEAAGNASSSNSEPRIDTDHDGLGEGTVITDSFSQFTHPIAGTGSLLDIRIQFVFDKQYEDIAIDNIEIWGIAPVDEVDWCNLQYPPSTTINFGDSFDVYGRVYEAGITDTPASPGAGITAWIGFSTTDATTTTDFSSSDWTWVPANYNISCPDCNDSTNTLENNDEYFIDIGPYIPGSGTYYYVTRFQYNSGPYSFGGYTVPVPPSPSGGNFWDGTTNVSQILTVNSTCASTVTWNGSWSGVADISTEVIIASDYDMSTLPSFSACSLTVNAGATLTIDDSKYIEINRDIIINGNLIVRPYGSVIQNNDNGTVTGDASVEKNTAILNNWYEYTYWSSPVFGETIETALSDSNPNRRFWFNAANFEDAMMETNNDNVLIPGQDDIDDDANDWQPASGTMTPGVGYAATHSENAFIGAGNQYKYTFDGPLNNGVINVPVVRNDAETGDFNWNFIGNPYPSAIDVDLFFDKNYYDAALNPLGLLDGAIYLWSQNTPPTDTNNGNEVQNFDNTDYAIINGLGENPGGDGITPNRYIPSGQGFFSVFSDNAAITSGNAIFNNSMRVNGNNDQFFRLNNSSQLNKLSIKLTSDNGVFNQLLVGYVDEATDGFDGMYFDAPRNLSMESSAIIYSIIQGHSRKFAIQGKNPANLNDDEVITIGFKNSIELDTEFTLYLINQEGDFMNTNTIYLRDNLLNVEHDLTSSSYNFTSEVGEFNERFEIHFTSTLSTNDLVQNELIVINDNDIMSFSTSQNSIIKNVQIFDLLGRLIYNVDSNNEASVSLNSKLINNTIFIAKATLKNGSVLTKKLLN